MVNKQYKIDIQWGLKVSKDTSLDVQERGHCGWDITAGLEEKVGSEQSLKWREESQVFQVGHSMSQGKKVDYM